MSMSPVSRPGPSRNIHTQESFFWFRKLENNQEWSWRDQRHAVDSNIATEGVSLCGRMKS
jgi:hypothetical protein